MSKNSKWDNIIEGIFLEKKTYFAGTELIDFLCEQYSISRDYARQTIKRSVNKKIIKSSHPFRFRNGQYVYMRKDDDLNLETLINITKKYKHSMYRVLSLLIRENNILSYYEARKAAATPVDNIEKYKLTKLDEEIKELIKHEFISIVKDEEKQIKYIVTKDLEDSPFLPNLMRTHFEKMRLDSIFMPDIVRWLKEHNFIDSNILFYRRSDNPAIGTKQNDFLWDGYSYTNTTGFSINTGKKDKKTLLVLDVVIHREYSKEDLDSFYNRIQSVRNSTCSGVRKILPIIFYVDVNDDVKSEIKRLSLLNFSMQNIFGTKVTEIIEKLDSIQKLLEDQFSFNKNSIDIVDK